ncbi:hypothetical protein HY570_03960, partial [Candidatus Micrarchaeota archaeon]|nr:hypothetical protein [Candidatus Micrarchaeota archaeon]
PRVLDCAVSARHFSALKGAASQELKGRQDVEEVAAQLFSDSVSGAQAKKDLGEANKRIGELNAELKGNDTKKISDELRTLREELEGKKKELGELQTSTGTQKKELEDQVKRLDEHVGELIGLVRNIDAIADVSTEDQETWDRTVVLAGIALGTKGIGIPNNVYLSVLDGVMVADWLSSGVEPTEDGLRESRAYYDIGNGVRNIFNSNRDVTEPGTNLETIETIAAIAALRAMGSEVSDQTIADYKATLA